MKKKLHEVLKRYHWTMNMAGIATFDGQWGSTGKGLMNHVLMDALAHHVDKVVVTTNAGPNSGHTFYLEGRKIVLKQLPVAGVVAAQKGILTKILINGGAVIRTSVLLREQQEYLRGVEGCELIVHPNAAMIVPNMDYERDAHQIASTGQGVGPAIIRKLMRNPKGEYSIMKQVGDKLYPWSIIDMVPHNPFEGTTVVIVEIAQGYGLGINSGMWPYVTSRECSVAQGLADAGMAPKKLHKSIMSMRAHPIRVGSTEAGFSGPCYDDQMETTWEELGVEPEYTTVTKRVRRVFTWSWEQFRRALLGNSPDAMFLNFCNYLEGEHVQALVRDIYTWWDHVLGGQPNFMLLGFGPNLEDVYVINTPWEVPTVLEEVKKREEESA